MIHRAKLLAGALVLVFAPAAPAAGQQLCPNCGRVHSAYQRVSTGQQVAQARANYLARGGRSLYRRVGGHPGRGAGVPHFSSVGSFEGTGMTARRFAPRETIATCRPGMRSGAGPAYSRPIVGDAVATGPDGTYRVRIWGSPTGNRVVNQPTRRLRIFRR